MRRPDFPLVEAAGWFFDDVRFEVASSTHATYVSWVTRFCARHKTLAEVTPDNAQAFIRDSRSQHTAMNKAIALKRFSRYLAEKKLWYEGDRESVLRDVKQPRPLANGQPPYTDDEIRTIIRAVTDGRYAARNRAVVIVLLHGLRAREARVFQLRNLILPAHKEMGHLVIEDSKTPNGLRPMPLGTFAVEPIREYIRLHRPRFADTGLEPLFLTDDGKPFKHGGWHIMAQRLRRLVETEGIPFRQHRLRSTSVRIAHEAGWPDSVTIAAHGWSPRTGQQMLARYRGPIPVEQMKKYPDRFNEVMRRVV